MFNITQSLADTIFSWANILLVIGAVLALIGTAGVVWSGGIREKFADERISANEAETAKAKAETAEAKLEQERLKAQMAWRRVSLEQAQRLVSALQGKPFKLWLTFVGDDPESTVYREDINEVLTAAGLETTFYSGYVRAVGLTIKGGSQVQRSQLLQAFHSAGLPLIESNEQSMMSGALEILVGTKPPPDFQN